MKPIKIAQIGTGHDHARPTFLSLLQQPELFDLIGIAEPSPAQQAHIYTEVPLYTVEQLLAMEDLEAVAIETEECLSTEYAQMFADKGVAIHLDKPGSQDLDSYTRLIETVKAGRIPFQLGYMYRYNPLIRRMLDMVRRGELGEIFSVEAQMSVCHLPEKRQWLSQFKGGMLYYLGCHLIDLVLLAQGFPQEVIPYNLCTGVGCENAEDMGFAVLRYERGVSFVKSCATEHNGFERRQLVITGSKGSIEIKPLEAHEPSELTDGSPVERTDAYVTLADWHRDPWRDGSRHLTSIAHRYDAMMAAFARYIRGEEENPYTYDYELALFKVILQATGCIR